MNKNVIIGAIGAVVLLLSLGGCAYNLDYAYDYYNPEIRTVEVTNWRGQEQSFYYEVNKEGKWYRGNEDGSLTAEGKAALEIDRNARPDDSGSDGSDGGRSHVM